MNRLIVLAALASTALLTATPAFAQGRFGAEAAERAADRAQREANRRPEHPEVDQVAAAKPVETQAPNPTPAPALEVEPSPATAATPAPAETPAQ